MKRVLILALFALWPQLVQAQPPQPTGVPETKQWEDWNKARPVIPAPPTLLAPVNGATNVPINTMIQVQSIGADRLEWRYGTSSNPPLISNQTFSYTPTGQKYNTKYYVRVRGVNAQGTTVLITFSYTTGAQPNPPIITCPQSITVSTNTTATTPVQWNAPVLSGGQLPYAANSPSCMPASGSLFPNGTTSVTCSGTDSALPPRTAMCTFPVSVNYLPPQPVESPIGWRVPRDGQSVVTDVRATWTLSTMNKPAWCATIQHPEWCLAMLNNGFPVTNIAGFEYEWFQYTDTSTGEVFPKTLYVRGDDAFWYYIYPSDMLSCTAPCVATVGFFGDKAPSEMGAPLPPACRNGLDDDGDGKIDFKTDGTGDPDCLSPDGTSEVGLTGPSVLATHDGVLSTVIKDGVVTTLQLVFKLYIDGLFVSQHTRADVWSAGTIRILLPTGQPSGTHVVQVSAANLCPYGPQVCAYEVRESALSACEGANGENCQWKVP